MLEPMQPISFCMRGKAKEKRCIEVIISLIYIGVVVMKDVMLDSPYAGISPYKVHGITHVFVDGLIFGIRTVDSIMHHAHSDPGHSKSTGDVQCKKCNWGTDDT